jgi:glucuronate isomerase
MTADRLTPHPDRLLPVDPAVRGRAREIYESIRGLPIISPHGHVDPALLLDDRPFADPATLFVSPDHYVTRLMHASGVSLDVLGVGRSSLTSDEAKRAWKVFCEHWHVYDGTPMQFWLVSELSEIFGITDVPGPATADSIYDQIAAKLGQPEFRPRALFARFNIDVLATTDDPADSLAVHQALAADSSFAGTVIPTYRPDRYLETLKPGWHDAVAALSKASGVDTATYAGYRDALQNRREYFKANGAKTSDHSHLDAYMTRMSDADATGLYAKALAGTINHAEAVAFRRHMMWEMARMATEDGLVMTLHHGVYRNHHTPTLQKFGPDTGHDIPLQVEWVNGLHEVLQEFGTHPNLRMVLFALDESGWGRDMAPLAGFYPSVYVGSPWWFLDQPAAIRRWRQATTEIVGFTRFSGFIDDTRAFCSIPARHDMSRRLDAGFLAELVSEHRISMPTALRTANYWTQEGPREVFKL